MNTAAQLRNAYGDHQSVARTPRQDEYRAFAFATHQLASAVAANGANFSLMAQAVHDNLRLWSTLAADVAGDENGLPADLRAGIFYLADFTRHHSRKVLDGEADASALIDINTSVMRGLRSAAASPTCPD